MAGMAVPSNNALSLLRTYDDDSESSDEDLSVNKICAKRRATEENHPTTAKRRNNALIEARLPLPAALQVGRNSTNLTDDDPTLHEGRIRSFPHERGNWSTFVYVPYEISTSVKEFLDVVMTCMTETIDIKPITEYHVSLTRTVVLRHHWIDLFVKSVQDNVACLPKFQISFGSIKIYCNEERTRTFVGLEVSEGLDLLKKSICILDKCLAEFNLQPYYKDPSFHLSIAWTLGDSEEEMRKLLPKLETAFKQFVYANAMQWTYPVEQLVCKSGNKYFVFKLQN